MNKTPIRQEREKRKHKMQTPRAYAYAKNQWWVVGTIATVALAAVVVTIVAAVLPTLGDCKATVLHADPVRAAHANSVRDTFGSATSHARAVAWAGVATLAAGVFIGIAAYVDVAAVALVTSATGLTCATLAGHMAVHTSWVSATVHRAEFLCRTSMLANVTIAGALLLLAAGILLSAAGPLLGRYGIQETIVTFVVATKRSWAWLRAISLCAALASIVIGLGLTVIDGRGALESHVVPGVTEEFPVAIDTGGRVDVETLYVRGLFAVAFSVAVLLIAEIGIGMVVQSGGADRKRSKAVAGFVGAVTVGFRAMVFFASGGLLALFTSPLLTYALALKGERVRAGPHVCVIVCVAATACSVVAAALSVMTGKTRRV